MAQTALNGKLALARDTWVLVSEINCTFVVLGGNVEIIGMDGAAPTESDSGIPYPKGTGETFDTDVLARYAGSGTADRIYARSSATDGSLFVSRAAVS